MWPKVECRYGALPAAGARWSQPMKIWSLPDNVGSGSRAHARATDRIIQSLCIPSGSRADICQPTGRPGWVESFTGRGIRTTLGIGLGEKHAEIFAGPGNAAFYRANADPECLGDVAVR